MFCKIYIFILALLTLTSVDAPMCKGLKCWYKDYNEKYFSNHLPENTDVGYGPCPIANVQACDWNEPGHFVIRLIPKYNLAPDTAHFTLLHEMCHLDTFNSEIEDHGPMWQACMHRLANLGAFDNLW